VSASKEYVLLRVYRVLIIIIRWVYSKNFINNVDGVRSKYLVDRGFLFLVLVLGGLRFCTIEVVLMVFVCIGLRMVTISNI
jgi:hypothetical protein